MDVNLNIQSANEVGITTENVELGEEAKVSLALGSKVYTMSVHTLMEVYARAVAPVVDYNKAENEKVKRATIESFKKENGG